MSRPLKNPPKCPHIEVNISTWVKDSHGLYDYEAPPDSYRNQTYYIKNSSKVYRDLTRGDTLLDTNNKLNDITHAFIGEVIIDKSNANPEFRLKTYNRKEPEINEEAAQLYKTTYLVIRQFTKNGGNIGYPLRPGNIIKLGRVEYMVIESKNQNETQSLRSTNHFEETTGVFQISKNKIEKIQNMDEAQKNCKVCLCNEETEGDPLISPCKCKGTCRLIHVGCLRTWINSKVKKQLKGIAASYNFTKFECQICKFPFPQIVRFENNRDVEMMTISKPNKPYIILESLCNKTENKEQRCLHLISTEENTPIKIGRGHECQIRITDISVSRKHAEIILKEGQFYIVDTKAKFGTLIKLQQDFVLTPTRSVKIQCGRTVYEFKAKSEEDVDTE